MPNFSYLTSKPEYALFAPAAIEAERVFVASPAMCAVGCRKALELAVKWVYAADGTMEKPFRDERRNTLTALLHELSFSLAVEHDTWHKLPYIVTLGNRAVHTEKSISAGEAVAALRGSMSLSSGWITATGRTMPSAPLTRGPSPPSGWR